jgi:hypothetical protein
MADSRPEHVTRDETGSAGTRGKWRPQKPRQKKESPEDE